MKKAKKYIISGRVQGVGYRYFVYNNATKFSIKGYVKNLYNGDVEVYAIGEENSLKKFREILEKGPPSSMVLRLEEFEMPIYNEYRFFEIAY